MERHRAVYPCLMCSFNKASCDLIKKMQLLRLRQPLYAALCHYCIHRTCICVIAMVTVPSPVSCIHGGTGSD